MRAAFFAVAAAFLPIVACSDDRPAEPTNPVAISASVFGAASGGLPYQTRIGDTDAPWAVGDSRQLHVVVSFAGGSANVSSGLTWSSSNSNVLRVTKGGQATALTNGSATVSAKTSGGKHTEGTITVGPDGGTGGGSGGGAPPGGGGDTGGSGGTSSGSGGEPEGTTPQNTVGGVTVTPEQANLRPGDTGDLDATVWDAWGNPMSGRTPSWTSSNPNVVTVTASGGLSAKGMGTATITAAASNHSAQAGITVSQSAVAPSSPAGGAPQGGAPQGSAPPPPPGGSSGGSGEPGGANFSTQQDFNSIEGNGWYSYHFGLLSASGGVLQMAFPAHSIAPDNSFSPGVVYYPHEAYQTVYMRMRLRLSDNFQGNPSCAQKLFEWFLGFNQRVLLSLCGAGGNSFRLDAFGRNDSRFAMNRSNPTFTRGSWHTVEAVASLNSAPGVPDGTFAYYLDGQVAAYYTNVVWIFAGESMMPWTEFKVDPVWGGLGGTIPSDQFLWIDDIYLSGR